MAQHGESGGRGPSSEVLHEDVYAPRPEAEALPWTTLLSSPRKTTEELLIWLHQALRSVSMGRQNPEQLATSLLISGERGAGKTTVLLTAASALEDPAGFFAGAAEEAGSLRAIAQELKSHVILLESLDLEPLPRSANLLATLLVRVRNALDTLWEGAARDRAVPRSILEESAESPAAQIDGLLRDATWMWESLSGDEARQRAEQQLKSAGIFARFQHDLANTMERVAEALSRRRFGGDGKAPGEQVILVIPIDNVDRSIEHLYNILKLTRMVACQRLWFLLAAGQNEVQMFLERSFQVDLATAGKGGLGTRGEEETLSIARRQAAAVMRRVLPLSHRLSLEPVKAVDAWGFVPVGKVKGKREPLSSLLEQLPLPGEPRGSARVRTFKDLFHLQPVEEGGRELPFFTHQGELALTLPPRNLLDLWQALRREVDLHGDAREALRESAIAIATTMLRSAIDESNLPFWASDQFQRRIIRRNERDEVVLDLMGRPIRRLKKTSLSERLAWPRDLDGGRGRPHRGELHLRSFQEVVLEQHDLERVGRSIPLPPNVSGWFMLLHDLLMCFEDQRVLNVEVTPHEVIPELVVTLHEAPLVDRRLVELLFWWRPPAWSSFIDFAIFTSQWRVFLAQARGLFERPRLQQGPAGPHFSFARMRYVLAAWIDNVCSVAQDEDARWISRNWRTPWNSGGADFNPDHLLEYERQVREGVRKTYARVCAGSRHDRELATRDWLEQVLPLLLGPELIPGAVLGSPIEVGGKQLSPPDLLAGCEELGARWRAEGAMLEHRRYAMVREALERSEAFEALKSGRRFRGSLGERWLDKAAESWLGLADQGRGPGPFAGAPAEAHVQ